MAATTGPSPRPPRKKSSSSRLRRLAQKPAISACNGRQAPALALAVERALFDQGKTAVVVTEENAGDADERRRVAQLLTSHGLVAIAVNLGTDIANAATTADNEQEIPEAEDPVSLLFRKTHFCLFL